AQPDRVAPEVDAIDHAAHQAVAGSVVVTVAAVIAVTAIVDVHRTAAEDTPEGDRNADPKIAGPPAIVRIRNPERRTAVEVHAIAVVLAIERRDPPLQRDAIVFAVAAAAVDVAIRFIAAAIAAIRRPPSVCLIRLTSVRLILMTIIRESGRGEKKGERRGARCFDCESIELFHIDLRS